MLQVNSGGNKCNKWVHPSAAACRLPRRAQLLTSSIIRGQRRAPQVRFRKPNQLLLLKARQELNACRAYIERYFGEPLTPAMAEAKTLAVKATRRLASAIKRDNARAIEEAADLMAEAMVYLWAVKQFREKERRP